MIEEKSKKEDIIENPEESEEIPAEEGSADKKAEPVEEEQEALTEESVDAVPAAEAEAEEDESSAEAEDAPVEEEPEGKDGETEEALTEEQKEEEKAEEDSGKEGALPDQVIEEDQEKHKNMKWYVVHTYSGREKKVRETLMRLIKNSGFEEKFGNVLVATEEVAEMKKGKKRVKKRKLFPSYIIIQMEMNNQTWNLVENVPGVTHFVGGGEKPFPIPKRDVDRILGRMEKREGVIPEVPFTIGEHVNVVDGPFSDFTGIVDEISPERGKLKVLVSIFGRETPVELDFLQVKPL